MQCILLDSSGHGRELKGAHIMTTIARHTMTFLPTQAKAEALATKLRDDDPDTDYRVMQALQGYYVAVFEGGVQIHTI